ncbi:hypothetical protein HDU93_003025 [Gonapodya sp. JEL0774]|nr:hypothetical protein HDU93_003025 [Gonapodya sp. JEL0774]
MQTADFSSMRQCVRETYKQEGVQGFYRGCIPTIAVVALLRSVAFYTYHQSRGFILHNIYPHPSDIKVPSEDISVGPAWAAKRSYPQLASTTMVAGGIAGTVQSIVNAPLEFVKIARQLERMLKLEEEARRKVMEKAFESAKLPIGIGEPATAAGAVKQAPVRPIPTATTLSPNPVTTGTALRSMATWAGGGGGVRLFSTTNIHHLAHSATPLPKPPSQTLLSRVLTPDSSLGAAYRIARLRGPKALYTGVSLHTLRDFFGTGIYWFSYESAKHFASLYGFSGPGVHMAAGGMAGAISWLVTFPVDLVKSVVQKEALVGMSGSERQWKERMRSAEVARRVWRRGGWRALYNGVGATVVRAVPIHALNFLVYEAVLKWTTEQYNVAMREGVQLGIVLPSSTH